jgi:peptide/nickel transport system ATP-binding protein
MAHAGRVKLREIPGVVPSMFEMPAGCAFAPRCSRRIAQCEREKPVAVAVSTSQRAACFAVAEELALA